MAYLVLETGEVFQGQGLCLDEPSLGELAFTTAMTGYQETITDPSYAGQIVVMSTPVVGAYPPVPSADQADRAWLSGLVIREVASGDFENYLLGHRVPTIQIDDTRELVIRIRQRGALRAGIFKSLEHALEQVLAHPSIDQQNLVSKLGRSEVLRVPGRGPVIGLVDAGVKQGIVQELSKRGAELVIFPHDTPWQVILEHQVDALLVSNGPGDPRKLTGIIKTLERLMGRIRLFGICFGHQLLALAAGAKVEKMKFGHRGANHPVKDLGTGQVLITTQNHGFVVSFKELPTELNITHISLFDETIEGLELPGVFRSVQFHPEARPGPRDATGFFDLMAGQE